MWKLRPRDPNLDSALSRILIWYMCPWVMRLADQTASNDMEELDVQEGIEFTMPKDLDHNMKMAGAAQTVDIRLNS